jgi:hypothetical protein
VPNPELSDLIANLHNRAQKAKSEAQAIEDVSARRAINELATAISDLARHLKRTSS